MSTHEINSDHLSIAKIDEKIVTKFYLINTSTNNIIQIDNLTEYIVL